MMYHRRLVACALACMLCALAGTARGKRLPRHPSQLAYLPLDWELPMGEPYRLVLDNGLIAYIAEDHSLPVMTVSAYFRAGSITDPQGKEGLGAFAATLLRAGGTEAFPADTLDELLERLAISVSFGLSTTQFVLKADFLSQFADTAFSILEQMLFHPAFEEKRIEREKEIAIQGILHRFDNPGPILDAAYTMTMYPGQANSRLTSRESIQSLTRDDLSAFRDSVVTTSNAILAVSGDMQTHDVIAKLERIFPALASRPDTLAFPQIAVAPTVRYLVVHKEITQAHVRLGLPLFARPHPDYYPMSVLSRILGGGGFTSRLTTSVRSDAGLTYSIYSHAESNYVFPATFYVHFSTKQESVNQAVSLSLAEVRRIVAESVTEKELEAAKRSLIDGLPSMFRNKDDIVDTYAWNEYAGRAPDHYARYPGRINALSHKDISRVAEKYLVPEAFTYVIVGDTTHLFSADSAAGFSLGGIEGVTVTTPEKLAP